MGKMEKTVKLDDLVLVLLTFKSIYSFSNVIYSRIIDNIILMLALICFMIVLVRRNYSYKHFFAFVLLGVFFVFCSFRAGMWYILITFVAAVLMSKMNFYKSLDLIFKVQFIFVIFHIILSFVFYCLGKEGMFTNFYGENRLTLLLSHPNVLSMLCITLLFEWTWLHCEKIKTNQCIGIIIVMLLIYFLTKTDVVLPMLLLEILFIKKNKFINVMFNIVAKYGIPIATIMCWTVSYMYRYANGYWGIFIKFLDELVSRRISILAMQISLNKIGLLGNGMNTFSGYNYDFEVFGITAIDNVYFTVIFYYGLIYIIILSYLFYKLAKLKSPKVDFYLTAFVIYGLVEGQIIISLVFPSLLLTALLLKNKADVNNIANGK